MSTWELISPRGSRSGPFKTLADAQSSLAVRQRYGRGIDWTIREIPAPPDPIAALKGAASLLEHAAMRLRIHGDPSAVAVAAAAKAARAALEVNS